jgi:hypothetical protein
LTSAAALTALRELPNTNAALHHGITGGKIAETAGEEDDFREDEDDPVDYGSDIPIEVVTTQIVSDNNGGIVRTGVAEQTDVMHDDPTTDGHDSVSAVSLGRGHRVKVVSTRYGAA